MFLPTTTFLAAFGIIFLAGLAHIKITKHKMLRRAKRILGDHGAKETGFKCSFRNNHGDHVLAVKLRLVVFSESKEQVITLENRGSIFHDCSQRSFVRQRKASSFFKKYCIN